MVCLNKKKKPKLADLGFFFFSKSSTRFTLANYYFK